MWLNCSVLDSLQLRCFLVVALTTLKSFEDFWGDGDKKLHLELTRYVVIEAAEIYGIIHQTCLIICQMHFMVSAFSYLPDKVNRSISI